MGVQRQIIDVRDTRAVVQLLASFASRRVEFIALMPDAQLASVGTAFTAYAELHNRVFA